MSEKQRKSVISKKKSGLKIELKYKVKIICKRFFSLYKNADLILPDSSNLYGINAETYAFFQGKPQTSALEPAIGLIDYGHNVSGIECFHGSPFKAEKIQIINHQKLGADDLQITYEVRMSIVDITMYAAFQAELLQRIESNLQISISSREIYNNRCAIGEFALLYLKFQFADYTEIIQIPFPIFSVGNPIFQEPRFTQYECIIESNLSFPIFREISSQILHQYRGLFSHATTDDKDTQEKIQAGKKAVDTGVKYYKKFKKIKGSSGSIIEYKQAKSFDISESIGLLVKNTLEAGYYYASNPYKYLIIDQEIVASMDAELLEVALHIDSYPKVANRIADSVFVISNFLARILLSDAATIISETASDRAARTFIVATSVDAAYGFLDRLKNYCIGMMIPSILDPPLLAAMVIIVGSISLVEHFAPHDTLRRMAVQDSQRIQFSIGQLAAINRSKQDQQHGRYFSCLRKLLGVIYDSFQSKLTEEKANLVDEFIPLLCGNTEKYGAPILGFTKEQIQLLWSPGPDGGRTEVVLPAPYLLVCV